MSFAEEAQKKRRFAELAERAYTTGRCLFTPFMAMDEVDLLLQCKSDVEYAGLTLFGGTEGCERVMARFGDGEEPFPICCIKAEPAQQKFADPLTHRDLLGAMMNLEIARETLGDIYLLENVGYIFCKDSVAPILLEELTKARHTTLRCSLCENVPADLCTRTEERMIQVASLRADVLVAGVFKLSREESLELFRGRLVYIDGKITENNSGTVEEGNVISVRRHGKFRFAGVVSTSRKGKFNVKVEVYV
mgnify:CR=1 FL=1